MSPSAGAQRGDVSALILIASTNPTEGSSGAPQPSRYASSPTAERMCASPCLYASVPVSERSNRRPSSAAAYRKSSLKNSNPISTNDLSTVVK